MFALIASAILSIFVFSFVTISELPSSIPEVYNALAKEDDSSGARLPINPDRQLPPQLTESESFQLDAKSGAVWDISNRYFVFEKNADEQVAIASITKLMTALTFLDYNPGWETEYVVRADDRREGGKIHLYFGDRVLVRDLFYASLVGSLNTETIGLVHSTGMSEEAFVERMNAKALELGLFHTRFRDATGLSENNVSTAKDVARLASFALDREEISMATLTDEYKMNTLNGAPKLIHTTDELLLNMKSSGIKIVGGKTGYTESALYCFVGAFAEEDGRRVISVVLGAPTMDARFTETIKLVETIFSK